jgi:glutamate/tyrosine decarboxylase-like PLP-dependent enzyme
MNYAPRLAPEHPSGQKIAPALFPDRAERVAWNDYLTHALDAAERRVAAGRVTPAPDRPSFPTELKKFDFESPVPLKELLDWTISQLEHGVVHMTHPRYLGLYNPAPSFPSQCADRVAASFNPQLASATTSPAAVAIEAHVIQEIIRRAGIPAPATGHFTTGGSEANDTALVCALTAFTPDYARLGARAFSGQPVFYCSQDSHLAWIKIAHRAGVGRDAARLVPTDGTGRMSLAALRDAVAKDRSAGCVPFMIAATAGTTNAGMIDPISACRDVADAENIWLHVDAAWGGGAIASPHLRGLLAGIEQADSVMLDAHKWFATTMGCGMFLTRHPQHLSAAFNVTASYMPSHAPDLDPYVTTAQWSRRFVGLRLFLSLGAAGWEGHAAHVERAVELAARLAGNMQARGWTVANDPALAVVCLVPPDNARPVRDIVASVLASGGAFVSVARFEGQDVVRTCVTHGETTPADIDAVALLLAQAASADS